LWLKPFLYSHADLGIQGTGENKTAATLPVAADDEPGVILFIGFAAAGKQARQAKTGQSNGAWFGNWCRREKSGIRSRIPISVTN
jgi:hypothetical protein